MQNITLKYPYNLFDVVFIPQPVTRLILSFPSMHPQRHLRETLSGCCHLLRI